ncbi:low molecular weight phosphatase family protein [Glaciibacter flavus]|uniref:Low molecular weight phosphatase family protein n=1 Tax=Orlajensenia flava TaxID=2565934 RepID=A0A4S4FVW3_9MICO|nr:low molecular weight phosphatase family protein [Glaciibacter flavus]THG34478.1 low molecular weight phosphatase family protein [Glaciibacter flavus]
MRVLAVCTGNVCRSPLAQLVLASELREHPQVTVLSAGTHALVGEPMTERMRSVATGLGLEGAAAHRARQLTRELIAEADLILGLTREHRRRIVELDPLALRRTFTLREFARLSGGLKGEAAGTDVGDAALAVAVGGMRGRVAPPTRPEDDDVIDPYRRSAAVYARSAGQLVPAARTTADVLRRFVTASD